MLQSLSIGIIADDLTGANDTALQFHLAGVNTRILLSPDENYNPTASIQALAIPSETRNIPKEDAYEKVKQITSYMKDNLDVDIYYKKIDSTLRGNIAVETLGMLQVLEWDAAVVIPAFPAEGRVTVGGYHLLKGVPIEKTEMASDPHQPIYESHIPSLLVKQIGEDNADLIGSIELKTVLKGAGPILAELNTLIEQGKKLIVLDSVSTVDIEQVVLAIYKSNYNILTCGSAGAAQALSKILIPENKNQHVNQTIAKQPKVIISGSATNLSSNQITKLVDSGEIKNVYPVSLTLDDFINGISQEAYENIKSQVQPDNVVVIHASDINKIENLQELLLEHEITKKEFATKIVDILADLIKKLADEIEFTLITVGGETSYECCKKLGSTALNLIDATAPAIPLCIDNNGKMIVTKSGNLGTVNTLIEILRYFERHE